MNDNDKEIIDIRNSLFKELEERMEKYANDLCELKDMVDQANLDFMDVYTLFSRLILSEKYK